MGHHVGHYGQINIMLILLSTWLYTSPSYSYTRCVSARLGYAGFVVHSQTFFWAVVLWDPATRWHV